MLLIEDNRGDADLIIEALADERPGFSIHVVATLADALARLLGWHPATKHARLARRWSDQAEQHLDGGGLAGTVGPQEADDLLAMHPKAHAAHRVDLLELQQAGSERLLQALDLDQNLSLAATRLGVRILVQEGEATWIARKLEHFPRLSARVNEHGRELARFGKFRVIELGD